LPYSKLSGEFERDRLDYLETIRKQEQQLKLFQQITDKIHMCLPKGSNYTNLDKIKKEAIWNEDSGLWVIPELSNGRNGFPNAKG
jgi:kinesin family protein 3/17